MYTLVVAKGKYREAEHDYIFKDFQSFYELADVILVSFRGKYSIGIEIEEITEIQTFISKSSIYVHMQVTIYTSESVVTYLSLYFTNLPISEGKSQFEILKNIIAERQVLLGDGLLWVLYASIGHKLYELEEAVSKIVEEYGVQKEVSESMLASLFILNKITYPRTVLFSYLKVELHRRKKLKKCLADVGSGVTLGAMQKNIKYFVEEKANYFRTGTCSSVVKGLSTNNIAQMYRILVLERGGLNDVELLLELYERGISIDDVVQRRSD